MGLTQLAPVHRVRIIRGMLRGPTTAVLDRESRGRRGSYHESSVTISALDWNSLRPLDGSQQKAFEELCVQLASGEQMSLSSSFDRKGTPDAGVECYWTLPSGNLQAWQAKFFRQTPNASQWQHIGDSI